MTNDRFPPSGERRVLPLVYSCSGCSSAAQMANYVAVQLDRRGAAEMSCIAGVGGDVPSMTVRIHHGPGAIPIKLIRHGAFNFRPGGHRLSEEAIHVMHV